MVKFYEDLPPQPYPNPKIVRRLFGLVIVLHLVGSILSSVKQKTLMLFCDVLIEYEGSVFKQLADLY
jgi:hypothetical protein